VSFTSRLQDPAVYNRRGKPIVDHALGTAYTARLLAEHVRRVNVEEAFLGGLLHDIGKLVILKRAYECRHERGLPIDDADVETALADHHPAAGALVLHEWRLPSSLEEPLLFHHAYERAVAHRRETAVVYLANRLSHRYGFGCDRDEADLLADPVCAMLGFDAEALDAMDGHAPGLFEVARQFMG
jgi:putative nucleotidyltransferase with HDIG domain